MVPRWIRFPEKGWNGTSFKKKEELFWLQIVSPDRKWSCFENSRFTHKSPYVGPIKGVFPTPDTGPFFQSDTDIHPKISVARHWHSELSARHSTSARHWHRSLCAGKFKKKSSCCTSVWHSSFKVDIRHSWKIRVDTWHSDPPLWALYVAGRWWFPDVLHCHGVEADCFPGGPHLRYVLRILAIHGAKTTKNQAPLVYFAWLFYNHTIFQKSVVK